MLIVPLAKHLGLGAILGYLLAGMAMGPWGLGLVRDPEAILHSAKVGVVLMLFCRRGLELEPRRLWAMRRAVFRCRALYCNCSARPRCSPHWPWRWACAGQ